MQPQDPKDPTPLCTCFDGGSVVLPTELQPRPKKKSSLRKVTCPGCGLVYRTNRATDLCMECERKQET